jgi:hypothetical protein
MWILYIVAGSIVGIMLFGWWMTARATFELSHDFARQASARRFAWTITISAIYVLLFWSALVVALAWPPTPDRIFATFTSWPSAIALVFLLAIKGYPLVTMLVARRGGAHDEERPVPGQNAR